MIVQHTAPTLVAHRTGGAEVRSPKPLRHGQVNCPCCRKPCAVTGTGKLRGHKDLFGWPCYNIDPPEAA